jgi:hypothetical protein
MPTVVLILTMTLIMAFVFFLKRNPIFQYDSESLVVSMINVAKYHIDNGGIKYGLRFMSMKGTEDNFSSFAENAYRIYADGRLYGNMAQGDSQIGLQGWVYYFFAKYITHDALFFLIGNCLLLSLVISFICYEIYKKYGLLMAATFYFVSMCSSWIRDFSTNLYWVEFTWFIPMLLGLICLNSLNKRFWLYPLFFLAILVKAACGYEYITVVMLSSIMFLVAEWLCNIKKDTRQNKLAFKTIFGVGIFSLLGFASALVIHSYMRGDGNILAGIDSIYHRDALRRIVGYGSELPAALSSSIFDVLKMYLSNIPTGVTDNKAGRYALLLLLFFPICILLRKIMKRKRILNIDMYLFIISFLTCVSWFILAKSHSYIHTHMNYVMWFMGFIQIGTYLIIKYVLKLCYYMYNREKVSTQGFWGKKFIHKLLEEIMR